jgi:hypothetical protein
MHVENGVENMLRVKFSNYYIKGNEMHQNIYALFYQ